MTILAATLALLACFGGEFADSWKGLPYEQREAIVVVACAIIVSIAILWSGILKSVFLF